MKVPIKLFINHLIKFQEWPKKFFEDNFLIGKNEAAFKTEKYAYLFNFPINDLFAFLSNSIQRKKNTQA